MSNNVANQNDKRMTVSEVAESLNCTVKTVHNHIDALWPDLKQNGKTTYLTEAQCTILLEKMKQPVAAGAHANLVIQLQGYSTSQSTAAKIALLNAEVQRLLQEENEQLKAHVQHQKQRIDAFEVFVDESGEYWSLGRFIKERGLNVSRGKRVVLGKVLTSWCEEVECIELPTLHTCIGNTPGKLYPLHVLEHFAAKMEDC